MTSAAFHILLLTALCSVALPASASEASRTLRARGTAELYNLDIRKAQATFREAVAADGSDAAAQRALAGALWISIAMDRGTMTVDSYLGRVTRQDVKLGPPPAEVVAAFHTAIDRAVTLARSRLESSQRDVDAEYELGAAIGLRASYAATIDGSVVGGFRSAREAYDAHERVLELNPARRDAGLIVGTYRYLVASLSLPFRWVAYMAGFGGGRDRGIELIESAAAYPGDNQADARLALILIYNREQKYDRALTHLDALGTVYPGNRLLMLETGGTLLRAGRTADAERVLSVGISRLSTDTRPRMLGEEALWYYKRGSARVRLNRTADAQGDLQKALSLHGRPWVEGRAHFELGKLALAAQDRAGAREHLRTAIRLCDSDRDAATSDAARDLLERSGLK